MNNPSIIFNKNIREAQRQTNKALSLLLLKLSEPKKFAILMIKKQPFYE